ncbi:F-BAR domain only protein [Sarotherodon galilaeus]
MERRIKEGSRVSREPPSPARGSGASLPACVSARSNSRIPYLEARGSRCSQCTFLSFTNHVFPK